MVSLPDGRVIRQSDQELRAKLLADPNYDPNRPLVNQDTLNATDKEYADITAQQRQDAEVKRNYAAAAETPGLSPEDRKYFMDAERAKLGSTSLDKGITAPSLDAYRASVGATSHTMPQIANPDMRDFAKEQEMMSKLGITNITTDDQFNKMMRATYSTAELEAMGFTPGQAQAITGASGGVGDGQAGTMAAFNPDLLRQQGFSEEQIAALAQKGDAANAAQTRLNQTPEPTNAMMYTLQQALKAKSGVGNQALGKSNLFEQAGLTTEGVGGYGILAQNLSQRRREMGQTYDSYANIVGEVGGQMSDVYNTALDSYKATMETYDKAVEGINQINEAARDQQYLLEKMKTQHELDKDMEKFLSELEGGDSQPNDPYADGDNANVETINNVDPVVQDVFGVGSQGGQCGTWASTVSTASKVGNMWSEKRTKIDKTDNPTLGDKLLIPLGVSGGSNPYGHVAVVMGYDPETGDIQVLESNRYEDERVTAGTYNINDLRNKYGDDWGFASGDLKDSYKKKLRDGGALNDPGSVAGAAADQVASGTAIGSLAKSAGIDIKGGVEAGYNWMTGQGQSVTMSEDNRPFEDRYFDATNDPAIFDSKSTLSKRLKNMTDQQKEDLLKAETKGELDPKVRDEYIKKFGKVPSGETLKYLIAEGQAGLDKLSETLDEDEGW